MIVNHTMRALKSDGFTLVELAVVVAVIALMLGSLLVPLTSQVEQRNVSQTERTLDLAREALLGYALINGRLPCPDTNDDGLENAAPIGDPESCAGGQYAGNLPWATLGVSQADGWGDRLKYRVTKEFARATSGPAPTALALTSTGDLTVVSRNPQTKVEVPLANAVPAVIISFGKNRSGATTENGSIIAPPPSSRADENANATATTTKFFFRGPSPPTGSATCNDSAGPTVSFCEFDDQVTWISTNILLNRLVAAGKLP